MRAKEELAPKRGKVEAPVEQPQEEDTNVGGLKARKLTLRRRRKRLQRRLLFGKLKAA